MLTWRRLEVVNFFFSDVMASGVTIGMVYCSLVCGLVADLGKKKSNHVRVHANLIEGFRELALALPSDNPWRNDLPLRA